MENSLFDSSGATAQGFEDARHQPGKHETQGEMLGLAEDNKQDEDRSVVRGKECKRRLQGVLKEMSVVHSDRLTVWRDTLGGCAALLAKSSLDGDSSSSESYLHSLSELFQHVGEDIVAIMEKLHVIITKLDAADLQSLAEGSSQPDSTDTKTADAHPPPCDQSDSNHEQQNVFGGDGQTPTSPDADQPPDSTFRSSESVTESEKELQDQGQCGDSLEESTYSHSDLEKDTKTDKEITVVSEREKGEETQSDWITVGLTGQTQDTDSTVPDACFIKVPVGTPAALACEVADSLSCLMVAGSEELVSRVVRLKVLDKNTFQFPVTVIVPFHARYRGNYRDVAVKIMDEERRVSYITPVTTDGLYGGQKGSFAEVKVYSLGLFAVVSCLKRENFTVQRRGLSLKLVMDPRICLNYLPGSFAVPVMAQAMIQPVEAVLLTAVKSRNDQYRSVASTSPLLYLTHSRSQPLRRPLAVTLPCPPNPEKKRGQKEYQDSLCVSSSLQWDHRVTNRKSILAASVKSKEKYNESLAVLGSVERQWSVLDQVSAKNQQNGLVSFEVTENFDRLLVVRLLWPLPPGVLTSLAEELEEAVCCHSVTVVLQRRQDEPHAVLVAALPSRDLSWELSRLRAQGYGELVDASSEVAVCEADQLLLCFSGNITSEGIQVGSQGDTNEPSHERLTFHSQRKNQLLLRLTEVDPFGNYSSPHYKGTLLLHKVTRGQLEWRGDRAALKDTKLQGEPVCKLSLTLPKKARKSSRPVGARVKLCEDTDSLSDALLLWLSEELSEEEVSLLVVTLRLRRTAAQMVRLRAGDSSSSRAFHLLAMWRRGLPAVPQHPKASQLARCLAKSGRPDLAQELLLRQATGARQSSC